LIEIMDYPLAKEGSVIEDFHGTKVADPFRWLEDPDSEETIQWVNAQNKLSDNFIKEISKREEIKEKITSLWNFEKRSVPYQVNQKYFFVKNDGLQNQATVYVQDTLDSEPRVLLDPNLLSEDGTTALSGWDISNNDKYFAYALSKKGSDWQEIRIKEIDGKDFDEIIHWCKFTGISWKKDSSGFYYSRYPKPTGSPNEEENSDCKVYFHKLGTKQEEDILIHEDLVDKDRSFSAHVTEDGDFLLLYSMKGTGSTNKVFFRNIDSDSFSPLFDSEDAQYNFIDNTKNIFYFITDKNAPNKKLISINIHSKEVKEVVKESKEPIDSCDFIGGHFFINYLDNAHAHLKMFKEDGVFVRDIALPFLGSLGSIVGKKKDSHFFVSLSSFLYPRIIFEYDIPSNSLKEFYRSKIQFDAEKYITKQFFATSKDGTKVPLFVTHKKVIVLDGNNMCLMHGYGGFNISLTPYFSVSVASWLELGGIFVDTNLRGGAEFGSKWHEGGMLGNKQNVFDDFISVAEFLIAEKYTSSKKLGIIGGSNGGLLVGACMTQRPELFGAVICQVPVTDMLRFHKFTVGKYWVEEYGCAENKEDFDYLIKYSPLHNVKKVIYPPTLVVTADHDDRVVSAHAKKFTATLQKSQQGDNPILLHIEMNAGHGAGKPTKKIIEDKTNVYTFLHKILNTN
jgi:prolyl oligopeptidase